MVPAVQLLEVFAREHGRRRAWVHGGASRTKRAPMQPGNTLQVTWKARAEDSLLQEHGGIAERRIGFAHC